MKLMRKRLLLLSVFALLATACSSGGSGSSTSTTLAVITPPKMLEQWVQTDLRPQGLLIGDTLTVAGDRFVVFEEIDGRELALWTSENGVNWSPGDQEGFPSGSHVLWTRGNEHGAVAVGWSGQPSWPPHPEDPPVYDQVWTTTDGVAWIRGEFQPVLPESTDYLKWYAEVTSGLAYDGGFLLIGQVRWFLNGAAFADDLGLNDGDIVAYPSVPEGGGCTIEAVYQDGEVAFSEPCSDYGIDIDADGLFAARPPVVATGNGDGVWEILDTVGLETVAVIDTGIGPNGVSLFSFPEFDVPRYWTSVDLKSWQTVEGVPGIDAEAVFSMQTWRDGWVADMGYQDVDGGELWWTQLGSAWAKADVPGTHGHYAAGGFGLITVTAPPDEAEARELWFTPDGVNSAVFDFANLFGADAVADGLAVGADAVVAVMSNFDESAEYPWIAKVWAGIPSGE